jgi:hypothetical protein
MDPDQRTEFSKSLQRKENVNLFMLKSFFLFKIISTLNGHIFNA